MEHSKFQWFHWATSPNANLWQICFSKWCAWFNACVKYQGHANGAGTLLILIDFMELQGINPPGTTGPLIQLLVGYSYEMHIIVHHILAHETIFSYMLSDWFNKWQATPFDQSAGSSRGIKKFGFAYTLFVCHDNLYLSFQFIFLTKVTVYYRAVK